MEEPNEGKAGNRHGERSARNGVRPRTSNELNGPVEGAAVQAGRIRDVVMYNFRSGDDVRERTTQWSPVLVAVAVLVVVAVVVSLTGGRPWSTVLIVFAAEAAVYAVTSRLGRVGRVALLLAIPVLLAASLALPVTRAPAMAVLFDVMPPGGEAEIIQVAHSADESTERLTVRVRNELAEPLALGELRITSRFAIGGLWVDMGKDEWHFVIDETMDADLGYTADGPRLHGQVRVDGADFTVPLAGAGSATARGGWKRQLTFTTGALVPPDTVSTLTIDIPMDITVRPQNGTETEKLRFNSKGRGQFAVYVELDTPSGKIGRCHPDVPEDDLRKRICDELRDHAGKHRG